MGEAIRDWLEADDVRVARRILRERSPEEIQQIQQEQQQEAERQRMVEDAEANRPLSPQELSIAAEALQKKAPHGKAQKVKF
jgi:hypothetical protein